MPTHATLHIYAVLLEKLNLKRAVSLRELRLCLEERDLGKSERTIARYIEHMRHEFGVEIVYDTGKRGYVLENASEVEVQQLLNLVKLGESSGLDLLDKKNIQNLLELIQFDVNQQQLGTEHLKPLLLAIQQRRYINFVHTNYHTGSETPYRIKAILLKQYQYRWYVIGEIAVGEYRTFGCDRIQKLQTETTTFAAKNNKEIRRKFEQVLGLNYSEGDLVKVLLKLTPVQANYLKSLPIHASQEIVEERKDAVIFSLHLIPNYELIQRLLMMGDQVKVLEPKSLQADLKKHLSAALRLYQK